MPTLTKPNARKNAKKAATPQVRENSAPNTMLSGIFGQAQGYGGAPLSQPFEVGYNNAYNPVTLNRILLTYAYMTYGIVKTVIDQPVEDGLRGGVIIKSDELDAEDLELLQKWMHEFLMPPLKRALKWAELYGGSGLIINTAQDPKTPLNEDAIGQNQPLVFIDADRWELTLMYINADMVDVPFNYYGNPMHRTRVVRMMGGEAPSFLKQRLQGWGLSALEHLIRPLNSFIKNEDLIYELLDEAKTDIWQIKGFNSQVLAGAAQGKTMDRLTVATMLKNYHRAIVMDSDDKYDQKQITFSGLSEILKENRIGVACAARMPMAKLFGLSAAGFNSGEDDIENYVSMVESNVRSKVRAALETVLPIICRHLFGFAPESITMEFHPLRVMSTEQEENIKSLKFNRVSAVYSQGLFGNGQEYAEELKKEGIMSLDTAVSRGEKDAEPPASPFATVELPQKPAKEKAPQE